MRFLENRRLAAGVLVVCILGSVFGLGGAAMARRRDSVLDVFQNGTEKTGTERYSMDAYLDRSVECAREMAYEAELLLGEGNANAEAMLAATEGLEDASTDEIYAAYQQMQKYSDLLYNAVYAADLTDDQRTNFKYAYDDFWGSDKYIQKDSYRALAADFNSEMKGFPAGIVTGLWGIDELSTFGG